MRLSEIKDLQIMASTLAEQKMNELDIAGRVQWSRSMSISHVISQPVEIEDSSFEESLRHQTSELIEITLENSDEMA